MTTTEKPQPKHATIAVMEAGDVTEVGILTPDDPKRPRIITIELRGKDVQYAFGMSAVDAVELANSLMNAAREAVRLDRSDAVPLKPIIVAKH